MQFVLNNNYDNNNNSKTANPFDLESRRISAQILYLGFWVLRSSWCGGHTNNMQE